jgi:hypothetical protein
MLTTSQNVDKAKKEIERLEAEEDAEAKGVNGDKKVEEATADLKEASLEEKKE